MLSRKCRFKTSICVGVVLASALPAPADEPVVFTGIAAQSVSFSPDGELLAFGGGYPAKSRSTEDILASLDDNRGLAKVWDLKSNKELLHIKEDQQQIACLAFSPKERALAVGFRAAIGQKPRSVRFWHLAGKTDPIMLPHPTDVKSLTFSPDGRTLATATAARRENLFLWDVVSGKRQRVIRRAQDCFIDSLAWSPAASLLAYARHSMELTPKRAYANTNIAVEIFDSRRGVATATLEGHTKTIRALAFSPDGRWLASGGMDNTVRIVDVATQKLAVSFQAHNLGVFSLAYSSDGKWLVTGGQDKDKAEPPFVQDGRLRIWEASTGRLVRTIKAHTTPPICLAFSPEGGRLASGSLDGTVKLWRFPTDLAK